MDTSPGARPRRTLADLIPRRPALPAAVAFMGGIFAHRALPHVPLAWVVAAAALVVAAALAFRRRVVCSVLVAVALVLTGAAAAQVAAFRYPRDHISAYASDEPRLAHLELSLAHPPRTIHHPGGRGRALPPKQVTTARVTRVRTWDGWVRGDGEILVQLAQPHPRLAAGQTVRALGMLQRPAPAMNPGQFDWAAYYREQRVLASFQVAEPANVQILTREPLGFVARLREGTRRLLAAGFDGGRSLDHALLRALLLGDPDPELRDAQDAFKRTGTSHHLSISGMHVAVLGGFVLLACRALRLTPRKAVAVTMAFVVLYGAVALPSPPVVRSVLLCLVFGVGLMSRRALDPINLLAVTVLLMLAYHPLDLYNAGFQLSFGTVLGLMVLAPEFVAFLQGFQDRDLRVATQAKDLTPAMAAARWADSKIIAAVSAAVVAWVVSLPLIARHFEQLNPWAVGGSLLLAPIVLLALVGGLLKVLLTLLWPGLAPLWATAASWPVGWMRGVVDWLAALPGSDVPLPAPPVWWIAAFYAMLLLTKLSPAQATLLWGRRLACVAACASIFFPPLHGGASGPARLPWAGQARVTFLAVGAGQCAVLEPPSGRVVLLDAGSASLTDLMFKCLGPYLRHRGRTEVDTVVVSHANYDHFSAVAEVVEGYDVREVLTGDGFRRHAAGNPPAEAMLAALDRLERPPRVVAPGDVIPLGRDTRIEVLWPPPGLDADANDGSLVFRLDHAGGSVLFTGDVQEPALRELLKVPERLRADVLVAPHHGSSEASTAAFVAAVAPTHVVSSNDRTLTGKQRRLDQIVAGRPLWRTNACGAITVTIDADGRVAVEPFLAGARPAGAASDP